MVRGAHSPIGPAGQGAEQMPQHSIWWGFLSLAWRNPSPFTDSKTGLGSLFTLLTPKQARDNFLHSSFKVQFAGRRARVHGVIPSHLNAKDLISGWMSATGGDQEQIRELGPALP